MKPESLTLFLAFLHFFSLGCLALYGIHRILFIFKWIRLEKTDSSNQIEPLPSPLPFVTVQLPLYNERYVAGRLMDAAANLEWPKNRIEIQVLDDSDDDTRLMVHEKAGRLKKRGVNIRVFNRIDRTGFKAGALTEGLRHAKGEFIAIFDADFIPGPDFLMKTMGSFSDPQTGMVQARWTFLNEGNSWLTGVQAILIGHHFDIEHRVRHAMGCWFNFNGTAGIFRKSCILSSGSWQSDTVTEDLDLSYRAQINHWKFVYNPDVSVPSELPATMGAFLRQQQRWAAGSTQTAVKLVPSIIRSPYSLAVKREALFHLLSNLCWIMAFIYILTLYPALRFRIGIGPHQIILCDLPLFMASCGAVLFYFFVYTWKNKTHKLKCLPLVPLLCIGLTPSIAVHILIHGFRKGGTFHRTPKFGFLKETISIDRHKTYRWTHPLPCLINLGFIVYTLFPVIFAWQRKTWPALPFLMIFPLSFFLVIMHDIGLTSKCPKKNE